MLSKETPSEYKDESREILSIEDPEDAREFIIEKYKEGERPIVSVPKRYLSNLEEGLKEYSTWIENLRLICGTFGREPYLPEGEERVVVKVEVEPDHIEPRFTGGPKAMFHGVAVLRGPISQNALEILGR